MECKYCGAVLTEDAKVCLACGREVTAEQDSVVDIPAQETQPEAENQEATVSTVTEFAVPEAKSGMSRGKAKALIATCVVLATCLFAILGAGVWYWINGGWTPRANDVTYKASYTVSGEKALDKADVVVATIADKKLTNGQLQVYYWMQFYNYLDYASQNSMFGQLQLPFDYAKPLDEQKLEDGNSTWQHFFLKQGLENWHRLQTLAILAENENFQLSKEYREYLDKLPMELEKTATTNGFASAQEMLSSEMGEGCRVEDYIAYLETYYTAMEYFAKMYEAFNPTLDEITAYFQEHSEEYEKSGIKMNDEYFVDVRHILVTPEGGTKDASGNVITYSDAEMEACRVEAQKLLDSWLAGEKTSESFGALANKHSTDPGSNTTGGLYTNVAKGDMVKAFDAWCFDASRKPGDYGLVPTEFGYHIMYFVGSNPIWQVYAKDSLLSQMSNDAITSSMENYEMRVSYSKIVLTHVDLS